MIYSDYARCLPCERESQLEGFFGAETAPVTGPLGSPLRTITLGVATGLTIWFVTRFLEHRLFKRSRR